MPRAAIKTGVRARHANNHACTLTSFTFFLTVFRVKDRLLPGYVIGCTRDNDYMTKKVRGEPIMIENFICFRHDKKK